MITVFCLHPDPFIAQSMAQTLTAAGITSHAGLPAHMPEKPVFWAVSGTTAPAGYPVFISDGTPMRIGTIARALNGAASVQAGPRKIAFGLYTLDTATRDFATPHGIFSLTEKEAAIIAYLHDNGQATRDDFLRDVWRYADNVDTHTVETHIYRLRRKIEQNPDNPAIIVTHDDGYALAAATSSA